MFQPHRVVDATDLPSVHRRVLAAAAANPAAIAIRDGDQTISYGLLERRATALARRLLHAGVAPGSVVAVRMHRSADQIVALLGAMMAGCAFLVIDPDDPEPRRAMMIGDSGAAAVIARAADGPVAADEMELGDAEYGRGIDLPRTGPEDLAYLVYTSGTTGVPNGVEITHDNLINFIDWTIRAFDVTRRDRAGYAMGLTFDAAQSEIWPYLACGAAVDVVDSTTRTSAERLQHWLIDHRITIGTIPMPLAEQLLSAPWPDTVDLRLLLTGGDVLRAFPRADLPFAFVNNYGPSECTIIATSGVVPVRRGDDGDTAPPTIGSAIDGAQIHLLDDAMAPVPRGDVGEVWIGGRCVGRGYRNRPELTASRFRPDPFSTRPGARLYRTGDLARQLASGDYAFCGRVDSQIKLRGVRIELDEIAVTLQQHPAVGGAVAALKVHDRLGPQLVAYAVPVPGRAIDTIPSEDEMRGFLATRLPKTHVPAAVLALATLPLTAHGKIDQAALPSPVALSRGGRAPETDIEQVVAEIITDVLGIDQVSATDDFFLLGGHSLLATQVVIQCREVFDVALTLRDLFQTPTIEALAAEIERRIGGDQASTVLVHDMGGTGPDR
jgi:amino acid adenylation domain-containing protein